MFCHVLCHFEGGAVITFHFGHEKIEDPIELKKILPFDHENGDYYRVIKMQGDDEYYSELLQLQTLARSTPTSDLGRIADHLICELLTAGIGLRDAEPIPHT